MSDNTCISELEACLEDVSENLATRIQSLSSVYRLVPDELCQGILGLVQVYRTLPKDLHEPRAQIEESILQFIEYSIHQPDQKTGLPSNEASKRYTIDILTKMKHDYDEKGARGEDAQRYRSLGFIVTDIDDFGTFNDEYGHDIGDIVLNKTGNRLSGATKSKDFISRGEVNEQYRIARDGGEEMYAILPDTNLSEAEIVAGRLVDSVSGTQTTITDPQTGESLAFSISISCGVASLSVDLKNLDVSDYDMLITGVYGKLNKMADNALYAAKNNGKNRFESFDSRVNYDVIRKEYDCKKRGTVQERAA